MSNNRERAAVGDDLERFSELPRELRNNIYSNLLPKTLICTIRNLRDPGGAFSEANTQANNTAQWADYFNGRSACKMIRNEIDEELSKAAKTGECSIFIDVSETESNGETVSAGLRECLASREDAVPERFLSLFCNVTIWVPFATQEHLPAVVDEDGRRTFKLEAADVFYYEYTYTKTKTDDDSIPVMWTLARQSGLHENSNEYYLKRYIGISIKQDTYTALVDKTIVQRTGNGAMTRTLQDLQALFVPMPRILYPHLGFDILPSRTLIDIVWGYEAVKRNAVEMGARNAEVLLTQIVENTLRR